jgi:hypothetical protein
MPFRVTTSLPGMLQSRQADHRHTSIISLFDTRRGHCLSLQAQNIALFSSQLPIERDIEMKQRRGRVVSIPASHSGCAGFKSWFGDLQTAGQYLKLGHDRFIIHHIIRRYIV